MKTVNRLDYEPKDASVPRRPRWNPNAWWNPIVMSDEAYQRLARVTLVFRCIVWVLCVVMEFF